MIDAVVFDMDGVLFDTEPLHILAWQEALGARGIERTAESFTPWIGVPDRDLAAHLAAKHPVPGGAETHLVEKRDVFRRIVLERLVPFAGLAEALDRCNRIGPLAVATSTRRDDMAFLLDHTGLGGRFVATVAYEDTDAHKPDPAPYALAAERLGVAPQRCAAVEDSPSGVASARAAGMRVAAVTSSFPADQLAGADRVFPDTPAACEWIVECAASDSTIERGNPA